MPNGVFFTSRGTCVNSAIMAMLYTDSIGNSCRTRLWRLKCVIVYLTRDIPAFVMYCVYGESGSSLLDKVIYNIKYNSIYIYIYIYSINLSSLLNCNKRLLKIPLLFHKRAC